jgi:hypothetical protein
MRRDMRAAAPPRHRRQSKEPKRHPQQPTQRRARPPARALRQQRLGEGPGLGRLGEDVLSAGKVSAATLHRAPALLPAAAATGGEALGVGVEELLPGLDPPPRH